MPQASDRPLCFAATLSLPSWVQGFVANQPKTFASQEDRMQLAIGLSAMNIDENTGGPFGAAVFESDSGRVVAVGVNVVVGQKASLGHAEAMALLLAQQALGTFDLSAAGLPKLELVTSAQPCIQCFGMTWWSGVQRLVLGATAQDVESLTGFEEGPVPVDWQQLLLVRDPLPSVSVQSDVLREAACEVLRRYRGPVYNAGSDK